MKLVEQKHKILESSEFKESFGAIIEDLKLNNRSIYFYPLFLIRRIFYVAIIIVFYDYPQIQLIVVPCVTIVPMIFYLITVRPFVKVSDNFLNIYNEFVLLFCFISAYTMNSTFLEEKGISAWGWVMVVLVLSSLLATWILIMPSALKAFINSVYECFGYNTEEISDAKKKCNIKKTDNTILPIKDGEVQPQANDVTSQHIDGEPKAPLKKHKKRRLTRNANNSNDSSPTKDDFMKTNDLDLGSDTSARPVHPTARSKHEKLIRNLEEQKSIKSQTSIYAGSIEKETIDNDFVEVYEPDFTPTKQRPQLNEEQKVNSLKVDDKTSDIIEENITTTLRRNKEAISQKPIEDGKSVELAPAIRKFKRGLRIFPKTDQS